LNLKFEQEEILQWISIENEYSEKNFSEIFSSESSVKPLQDLSEISSHCNDYKNDSLHSNQLQRSKNFVKNIDKNIISS